MSLLNFLAIGLAFFYGSMLSASTDVDNKSTVKIQTSRSDMLPWLNWNDGATTSSFNTAVHDQALYFSPDLNISPGYISKWKWIKAEKKFRFTIDRSKKYHNGQTISARDFEFVLIKPFISTAVSREFGVPISGIKNIQSLVRGQPYKTGMASGIKVIDDETIDVYVDSGHTRFLYSLGSMIAPLAPIGEFEKDLYTFKTVAVGCGPYKVVYVDPKTHMVRVERVSEGKGPRFVEYYSDKTALENKVDVAMGGGVYNLRKHAETNPNEYRRLQGALPNSIQVVALNFDNDSVKNPTFREALSYAYDRNQPYPDFPNKKPTSSMLPILSYGHKERTYKFDVERAKKLFASLPKAMREKEYILSAHGSPGTEPARYYVTIRDAYAAIGMKVKLILREEGDFPSDQKDLIAHIFGRYVESNPLMTFAYFLPGSSNQTFAKNDEYAETFAKAEETESIEERARYIEKLSEIIDKENVGFAYHQNYPVYYVRNDTIKSLGLEGSAWTLEVARIELKK